MDRKPLLGVDILLEIALIAPYTTLSSLMKTCRLLYHECAKIMARRPVVVTNITDLKSFLAFLSAEDASRCCHLRHLVLDTVVPMEAPSRRVWQSLSRLLVDHPFQSLTSLYLTHAERLMHLDPDFAVGVASLTGLTTLHIGPVGTTTLDALRKLRCDLRVLVLKYADGLDQRTGAPPEHCHPVIIAQHFRHTLETLDVHGYEAELSRARFPKPYPRMHELILNSPDCPVLAPPHDSFPKGQQGRPGSRRLDQVGNRQWYCRRPLLGWTVLPGGGAVSERLPLRPCIDGPSHSSRRLRITTASIRPQHRSVRGRRPTYGIPPIVGLVFRYPLPERSALCPRGVGLRSPCRR
ncbi:hypothetical protein C8Q77DRAFT_84426 [Trametes polyzona]|nr:hypothetical protein C8Q77DRAFT_84426 [Trametes polyzona]